MIASSCAQTLRVATIAAALRDSFSTVITKHVMVCIVNVPSDIAYENNIIQLLKSVLLIMAVLMVVLLLTTLNNVSVLQDILSTLHNAMVCGAGQYYFYTNG